MLFLVSAPARASEAGVNLLVHQTVAWSSSTMFDYTAEGVALAAIVAEAVPVVHTVAGVGVSYAPIEYQFRKRSKSTL